MDNEPRFLLVDVVPDAFALEDDSESAKFEVVPRIQVLETRQRMLSFFPGEELIAHRSLDVERERGS